MAFAVLGARARGPVEVRGAEGIGTSYPGFARAFESLGGHVTIHGEESPAWVS
jgi:5-enolpyruvylshikimate-3-phosphate synthase